MTIPEFLDLETPEGLAKLREFYEAVGKQYAAVAGELRRALPMVEAGRKFCLNPGGRPPFAPDGFEPYQYRADSIARVLAEIEKRGKQAGAVIAALATVHLDTPLIDEPAARRIAEEKQRVFDLESVLRKWWDRNKPTL